MKGQRLYNYAQEVNDKLYNNVVGLAQEQKDFLYKEYVSLLRKAAYQGHAEAQFELALQYEDINYLGVNNPNYNAKKSFYWYEKAFKQNHAAACLNLASYYGEGKIVKKNKAKEFDLMLKSFQFGNKLAAESIAMFYKGKKEYWKSIEWLNKSIEISPQIGEVKYELGKFYYEGLGLKKSFKKAYNLFLSALATDYITEYTKEDIYFYIGKMYFYGQFVKKSISKAKYLMLKGNKDKDHHDITAFLNENKNAFKGIRKERVIFNKSTE